MVGVVVALVVVLVIVVACLAFNLKIRFSASRVLQSKSFLVLQGLVGLGLRIRRLKVYASWVIREFRIRFSPHRDAAQ